MVSDKAAPVPAISDKQAGCLGIFGVLLWGPLALALECASMRVMIEQAHALRQVLGF